MIPRTIHHVWLGPKPVPEEYRVILSSWQRHHPDWDHVMWTESNLPEVMLNRPYYDQADKIVERVTSGSIFQLRSDLVRYEILSRYGGVYVDVDLECLRPIDWFMEERWFAGWEIQGQVIGNTIIGCEPGHPFTHSLVEGIPESIRVNRGRSATWITGPRYVTRMWHRSHDGSEVIHPQTTFYPFGHRAVGTFTRVGDEATHWPDAYTVHWWANQRLKRGVPLGVVQEVSRESKQA